MKKRLLASALVFGFFLGYCAILGGYRRAMVTLPPYDREPW